MYTDGFDDPRTRNQWDSRWTTEKFSNGLLQIGGEEHWKAYVRRRKIFTEGQGVMLRFRFAQGTDAGIFFESGEWLADSYRRFGIFIEGDIVGANQWLGTEAGGGDLVGNFKPKPDTWYNLMIVINRNGEFIEMIWDSSDSSRMLKYHKQFGERWANRTWRIFLAQVNKGEVLIDDYIEFSFGEIR